MFYDLFNGEEIDTICTLYNSFQVLFIYIRFQRSNSAGHINNDILSDLKTD
jgi:hypothetical protein